MPDMREEFEAWWNLPAQSELRKSCARGWAEVIWKASRAALRVRLPKPYGSSSLDAYPELAEFNRGIRECLAALQKAGIEVKP
ncbi:TPA: hypothetical protein ACQTXM_006793 [Pseudomonas aeruginosa]